MTANMHTTTAEGSFIAEIANHVKFDAESVQFRTYHDKFEFSGSMGADLPGKPRRTIIIITPDNVKNGRHVFNTGAEFTYDYHLQGSQYVQEQLIKGTCEIEFNRENGTYKMWDINVVVKGLDGHERTIIGSFAMTVLKS